MLDPQLEERLRKAAASEHVPVEQYVVELLERDLLERDVSLHPPLESWDGAKNLVELFADSPLKGLKLDFGRDPEPIREFSL